MFPSCNAIRSAAVYLEILFVPRLIYKSPIGGLLMQGTSLAEKSGTKIRRKKFWGLMHAPLRHACRASESIEMRVKNPRKTD